MALGSFVAPRTLALSGERRRRSSFLILHTYVALEVTTSVSLLVSTAHAVSSSVALSLDDRNSKRREVLSLRPAVCLLAIVTTFTTMPEPQKATLLQSMALGGIAASWAVRFCQGICRDVHPSRVRTPHIRCFLLCSDRSTLRIPVSTSAFSAVH